MKYRKRPVVVEATQWFKQGDHPNVKDMEPNGMVAPITCRECGLELYKHGHIETLEGGHIVCPGDYIITDIKGEQYPCKPDIFMQTYEEVKDELPSITVETDKFLQNSSKFTDKKCSCGGTISRMEKEDGSYIESCNKCKHGSGSIKLRDDYKLFY